MLLMKFRTMNRAGLILWSYVGYCKYTALRSLSQSDKLRVTITGRLQPWKATWQPSGRFGLQQYPDMRFCWWDDPVCCILIVFSVVYVMLLHVFADFTGPWLPIRPYATHNWLFWLHIFVWGNPWWRRRCRRPRLPSCNWRSSIVVLRALWSWLLCSSLRVAIFLHAVWRSRRCPFAYFCIVAPPNDDTNSCSLREQILAWVSVDRTTRAEYHYVAQVRGNLSEYL